MTFVARPFLGETSSIFPNQVKQHFATAFDGFLARLFFYQSIIILPTRVAYNQKETESLHLHYIIRGSKKSNIGNRGDELRGGAGDPKL